jgi:adenine-specific DNA glycosylase
MNNICSFKGRNALPLTIGHNNMDCVQKSSSTDDSQHSQSSKLRCQLACQQDENPIQTSTTTTTTTTTTTSASSVIINEQQSLLKSSSSRKHVRISSNLSSIENTSYRHTLLQALNATSNHQYQISPLKKITSRLTTKKHTPPPISKDSYVPRMIHLSDNSCWSSREGMTQSETSGSKCLILTQRMLNGSNGKTRHIFSLSIVQTKQIDM